MHSFVNDIYVSRFQRSPKKPAIIEALALNLADNTDAKLETMSEVRESAAPDTEWLGFNRFFDSNLRRTGE